ncbi:MAG: hypothetical protein IAG13_16570 [Deltaproteobacteria bacterium]|nr:hypothetical protein [Nannocystaceae bacterium]
MLLAASFVALGVVVVAGWPRWIAWWFEREDPRPLAVFRIAFAVLVVWDVDGLAPHFELLFGADGMFTASEAWAAFGEVGASGLLGALRGRFSLLWLVDGAYALPLVLAAFHLAALCLLVGAWTRPAAIVTVLLFDTLMQRNPVFWEGTEFVLRVFGVLLACSRCGATLGVDAWRRRRASGASTPERVPAWPRRLMLVQLALLFAATGLLKEGEAWRRGDAVYYALANTHFARVDAEALVGIVGASGLVLATWVGRTIEVLFPLALVGVVARWSVGRFAPLRGWRALAMRVGSGSFVVCSTAVVVVTGYPRVLPSGSRPVAVLAWLVVLALVLSSPVVARRWPCLAAWLLGRRVWVSVIALLLVGLWIGMNIGVFHPITLATLVVWFEGSELGGRSDDGDSLAYSPWAHRLGGVLIALHVAALLLANLPASTSAARPLALAWLRAARSSQAWGMWSTPPESDVFLRARARVSDDSIRELAIDLDPRAGQRPVAIGYDRRWKIVGRVARTATQGPYLSAYGRWLCRTTEGAQAIELGTITVVIARPSEPRETEVDETSLATIECEPLDAQ